MGGCSLAGFNPCSVGSCSGSRAKLIVSLLHLSFNPCSVGSCSGSSGEKEKDFLGRVSILVLLDHARGD